MGKPKSGPKEVFLHLLAIITLYVSTAALLNLLFGYIDLAFPDPLLRGGLSQDIQSGIRFDLALLVIVFPAYLLANWLIFKEYARQPELLKIRVRKWLIYLTLFLSSLILIGDLVALVYDLLQGDLASSFLLKVGAVFLVIGAVFACYFWDIRKSGDDE